MSFYSGPTQPRVRSDHCFAQETGMPRFVAMLSLTTCDIQGKHQAPGGHKHGASEKPTSNASSRQEGTMKRPETLLRHYRSDIRLFRTLKRAKLWMGMFIATVDLYPTPDIEEQYARSAFRKAYGDFAKSWEGMCCFLRVAVSHRHPQEQFPN